MDLDDLKPSVCKHDRLGYIYHTIFTRPTDGKRFHYIGQHLGQQMDPRYFGSGLLLRRLVRKHGREHSSTWLVCWATSQAQMSTLEKSYIIEAKRLFGKRCLNLSYGGEGGALSEHSKNKLRGIKRSKEFCKRVSDAKRGTIFSEKHKLALRKAKPRALEKMAQKRTALQSILVTCPSVKEAWPCGETSRLWARWILGFRKSELNKAQRIKLGLPTLPYGNTGNRHSDKTRAKLRAAWERRRVR